MTAAADAGPLMALGKLGRLSLLRRLYGQVMLPPAVYDEAVTRGRAAGHPDASAIQQAIDVGELLVSGASTDPIPRALLGLPLGTGEQHAIGLAMRIDAEWLLVDDALAREAADALGLRVKGTLGILVHAWREGLLTLEQRDEAFGQLIDRSDIWIDRALVLQVWNELRQPNG